LRHGKNNQRCQGVNIEEIQEKKAKVTKTGQKTELGKTGLSGFGNWSVRFSQNR
jgi:hypothetical protein